MAPTIGNSTSPSGCQVKGDVCCRPADWTDVAKFFIANYITHAFTVVTAPGARKIDTIYFMIWALFNPFLGVGRAFVVIARWAIWSTGDLGKAHKAGALYTLVKVTMDADREIRAEPENIIDSKILSRYHKGSGLHHLPVRVHGKYPTFPRNWLPRLPTLFNPSPPIGVQPYPRILYFPVQLPFNYNVSQTPPSTRPPAPISANDDEISPVALATRTPSDEQQSPGNGSGNSTVTLSNSHGTVKAGVAIFQVLYGSWELYLARGHQFEKYGYTAFSLTLVPYIAMSLLNLLAAIVEPQYPCVFLVKHGGDVRQDLKDEINSIIGGAVAVGTDPSTGAHAVEKDSPDPAGAGHAPSRVRSTSTTPTDFQSPFNFGRISRSHPTPKSILLIVFATTLTISAYIAPIVVSFILTRFEIQQSSLLQREWIVCWLAYGEVSGIIALNMPSGLNFRHVRVMLPLLRLGAAITLGIGVWVFVAKMILQGGICKIM